MKTKRETLSIRNKRILMNDVIFSLNILRSIRSRGLHSEVVQQIIERNDEFMSICFMTISNGYEPELGKRLLLNFVNNETDLFSRTKMAIQANIMLCVQSIRDDNAYFDTVAMLALSFFGLSFKKEFIQLIKESDISLYETFFKNGEFSCFDINLLTDLPSGYDLQKSEDNFNA